MEPGDILSLILPCQLRAALEGRPVELVASPGPGMRIEVVHFDLFNPEHIYIEGGHVLAFAVVCRYVKA